MQQSGGDGCMKLRLHAAYSLFPAKIAIVSGTEMYVPILQ
jgi:hypothetical protein